MPLERFEAPGKTEIEWAHQLLVCIDVNLLLDNVNKYTEVLLDDRKEDDVGINAAKCKCILVSRH
jgi:hypothetical protein